MTSSETLMFSSTPHPDSKKTSPFYDAAERPSITRGVRSGSLRIPVVLSTRVPTQPVKGKLVQKKMAASWKPGHANLPGTVQLPGL
mmetsp:Transcript_3152/g.6531  ORF Transcript_3152/g.6531 Transcript_3152/m.6531 type:complete len:86 (+) Transcript_3152:1092-1349(+)